MVEIDVDIGTHSQQPLHVSIGEPPRLKQDLLHVARVDVRPVTVESAREDPVAGERGVGKPRMHPLVVLQADEVGEVEAEIRDLTPLSVCTHLGLEQAQPQRRPLERMPRHAQQQHSVSSAVRPSPPVRSAVRPSPPRGVGTQSSSSSSDSVMICSSCATSSAESRSDSS